MFEVPYYHQGIRNTIVSFGALFSNLKIQRLDNTGAVGQEVAVPLYYGPKEKVFVRIRQDADIMGGSDVYSSLPRMAFEILGYNYDSTRALNRNNKIICEREDGVKVTFVPVPYNLDISLYLLTKGTEDSLCVMEQILPLFMPEYSFVIKSIPDMNISQVVPVILNGVTVSDDYEGDFQTRRLVTHTFNFTAKINLYGPVRESSIITRTDSYSWNLDGTQSFGHHIAEGDPATREIIIDRWEDNP